ncbi:MAG: NAD(P)-dependent glycerol-3-phosphate dehydrogenase [Planctomycetota bacterium]|nr:MAG: NAD(P)-dependent glycerol-3-phosphate dehydrogenase [Planctomycetota bacterium]
MSAERVAVLGGGSFGTVLAHLAGRNEHPTRLWMRSAERAAELNAERTNARYLGEHRLAESVVATTDLEEAVRGAALVVFAVPSHAIREVAGEAGAYLSGEQVVLSATKGLEPESFRRMTEVIRGETCALKLGALSGPNLAKEIIAGQPSAATVGSRFREVIAVAARLLHGNNFRIYGNHDLVGVELAGALKNVIAIASGLAHGLGFGANVRALIVTRGLAEIQRLGVSLGADPLTFAGLAGVGDLIVTCGSELSRNFRVGVGLAAGKSLETIFDELGEVAEGVNTARVAHALARDRGVAMPITESVHRLLFAGVTPQEVLEDLMTRKARYEVDFDYSAEVPPR